MFTKKALAFTLAETLIVMAVIGVVAALTLPNLNSSTNNKEKVAKVKKIYQNLNDAFGRAEAVYGPIDTWFTNTSCTNGLKQANNECTTRASERFTEFMKLSKICKFSVDTGCFSNKDYKYKNNTDITISAETTNGYKVITSNGTSLSFAITSKDCSHNEFIDNECGRIGIDIDGPTKGPSLIGVDTIYFYILKDGIIAIDYKTHLNQLFSIGTYASDWIIKNENMDYLKVDSSGKCPNGTQLSETVTSCN